MKTSEDFKPSDDVADSMAAAAARLNVPLAKVKELKRTGCPAFRGSRVHLGELAKALVAVEKELTLSDVLTTILEEVATLRDINFALAPFVAF